jgi:hypothetical protein
MDMKKTAKKIAALVAGTTMLGATIMGATALDLSNYPAPFVTNGVFSGKIVVGAKAATSDVVGAIDIAASLQREATSTSDIKVPGAAGEASVSGDAAPFKTGSDVTSFEEQVGTVKQTFTASDLAALKSGVIDTGVSSSPVKQYLKFGNTTMSVKYEENSDTDVLADWLVVPSDSYMFEYQLEFSEGAESEVDTNVMSDLQDEVVTMLGSPFTIVSARRTGSDMAITLLGGQVADVLRDGETKTYTIDGKDYEVTAVFISDTSTCKLSVNGVMTKELSEGKTQVLGSDVTIGVQSVLTNQREGIVEFYLGANKIKLEDSNYEDTGYTDQTVEVKGESVSNAQLVIKASNTSATNVKLNYIKYIVAADNDYYVPAGKGLKEQVAVDNEGAFLTDNWDITYAGLVKTGSTKIKLTSTSDYAYKLEFNNLNGDSFNVPYLTNKNNIFKFGDDDDDFIFTESAVAGSTKWSTNGTFIPKHAYFLVSDKSNAQDDKAATKVLRYQSINTGDNTVTFRDLSGSDFVVSYTGAVGTSAQGDLIVDGVTHTFYVGAQAVDDYGLSIDLDGDSAVTDTDAVNAVADGGAIIGLGAQTFNASGDLVKPGNIVFSVATDKSKFDEAPGVNQVSNITVNGTASEIHLLTPQLGGSSAGLVSDPNNDDYQRGYSSYGAYFEEYNPSTSSKSEELTIDYPLTQRYAQVFVTAGTVEVKEGQLGASGSLTTTTVNPIKVGLAVLDTDAPALGSTPMIVVGGPCANTVAAALLDNPADCAAGFTAGKATIKLFTAKNALLVAGYSAQDTLGASYVLAQPKAGELSGTEVEVVTADLNTITVNKVQ